MGMFDKAKDMAEQAKDAAEEHGDKIDKAKEMASEHGDKLPGGIGEKVADAADKLPDV